MSVSTHTVLVEIVDQTGSADDAVTKAALAKALSVPESALCSPIESLIDCELLEATENGYRPTVTAHELLALDVDVANVLVVDVVEE